MLMAAARLHQTHRPDPNSFPSMSVRPPAVAGMFYTGQEQALREQVGALLAAVSASAAATLATRPSPATWPKALIVPHAGYIYSGSTAAQAYARLAPGRAAIRRVVLLGPVHRVPVRGLALPGVDAFSTPLGLVALDQSALSAIAGLPQVVTSPAAHAKEHSLEVQLPLLQTVLQDFSLVPLAVGDASAAEVAEVLDLLWGGPETVIVVSSDLSHYLPYEVARETDGQTVQAILTGQPNLNHRQACGATPVNGLTLAARRHGLRPRLLAQNNSGDTAGDRQRVVGYAALAFEAVAPDFAGKDGIAAAGAAQDKLPIGAADGVPDDAGRVLLPVARAALAQALGQAQPPDPLGGSPWLNQPGASFVTLNAQGRLRGCIGSLVAHRTLLEDVKANAVAAGLRDPRFKPVTVAELGSIEIDVSVLSAPQPMPVASEADALARLRPGVDGLVFVFGKQRSTFLPQVWAQLPKPADFLAQLKRKAGLAPDFWSDQVRLHRYSVRKWTEAELREQQRIAAGAVP
jgi:AmmeMemoRadiSam system protein B/AmmeMemoRadiSam system protein A